jgi:hypothetical protein
LFGNLFVTGGEGAEGQPLSGVEKYDASSDSWGTVSHLSEARSSHAAVAVEPVVYILGDKMGENAHTTATMLRFDARKGTWSEVAHMPKALWSFASCAVGTDIYVFGGYCTDVQLQASVYKYDTVADTWSTLEPMPLGSNSRNPGMHDGLVYIVGAGESGRQVLSFAPVSGLWTTLGFTANCHRSGASFVLGGQLYAAGGEYSAVSVERYDVTNDTWAAVAGLLQGRSFFSAVTIASGATDLFDLLTAKDFDGH